MQRDRNKEIKEENRKIKRLRVIVDLSMNVIAQGDMPVEDASHMVGNVRKMALDLFPGKGDVFDLIYKPRFQRLIRETYGLH
jgi:hypothetical protein